MLSINILRRRLKELDTNMSTLRREYDKSDELNDINYELDNLEDKVEETISDIDDFLDDLENFKNNL